MGLVGVDRHSELGSVSQSAALERRCDSVGKVQGRRLLSEGADARTRSAKPCDFCNTAWTCDLI
jgi:hypothetical protein